MDNKTIPRVIKVEPHDDYTVTITFDDGKVVEYDAKHLLNRGVFLPLNDINFFKERCRILNNTLAWDISGDKDLTMCLDIDPLTIWSCKQFNQETTNAMNNVLEGKNLSKEFNSVEELMNELNKEEQE